MALRAVLMTSIVAVCSAVAVYNPPNAGNALDAIERALTQIVSSPHLTKTQLSSAKKVAADVEKTVTELESPKGKMLSKEAKAAKVTASIKELQDLQADWQKAASQKVSDRKAELMKELQAKEAELAKDKKMLKVINLEKQLAEKKLALQKLVDMKNEQAAAQATEKQEAAQQEMVANLLKAAQSLQAPKGAAKQATDNKATKLRGVQTYLEGRMHNVTDSIAKLDANEKKKEAELKSAVAAQVPANGKTDAIAKGQGLLKVLLKKEHRNYQKTRATLKSEEHELAEAVTSIKKGDGAGLAKVMNHMQGEMKSLQAKSHKFLY
jgi:hypothetical protein